MYVHSCKQTNFECSLPPDDEFNSIAQNHILDYPLGVKIRNDNFYTCKPLILQQEFAYLHGHKLEFFFYFSKHFDQITYFSITAKFSCPWKEISWRKFSYQWRGLAESEASRPAKVCCAKHLHSLTSAISHTSLSKWEKLFVKNGLLLHCILFFEKWWKILYHYWLLLLWKLSGHVRQNCLWKMGCYCNAYFFDKQSQNCLQLLACAILSGQNETKYFEKTSSYYCIFFWKLGQNCWQWLTSAVLHTFLSKLNKIDWMGSYFILHTFLQNRVQYFAVYTLLVH